MSRSPILFRCDATAEQGYESFYQCLIYGASLQRRRRGTYFLSRLQPQTLLSAVQKAGNEWRPAEAPLGSEADLQQTIDTIRDLNAAAVVVADPNISTDYLNSLADTGAMVMAIDAQAGVRFPPGVVVNPLLGPNEDSYIAGPGTQLLLGARYALTRPFIRRIRPLRSQEPPMPFRALVAMGDDDIRGQMLPRVKELMAMSRIERIDVAVRPHHPGIAELQALAEQNPDRLEVVMEPAEISLRLSRCHFALTSGDGWSLELACVGIPQLMLVQMPWHMLNAQRLDDEGAAINLGDCESVSPAQLRQAVQTMLSESRERAAMSRAGRKLVDGRGPDRLVNALEVMLSGRTPMLLEERMAA